MTKGVDYVNLCPVLCVSDDKRSEIEGQYQSDEQRCEAMIAHALSTHPCVSWKQIARGLQQWGYRKAAVEVTRKYVKGQLRTIRHINAGYLAQGTRVLLLYMRTSTALGSYGEKSNLNGVILSSCI